MAGHSHWNNIKRKKGANDAKRGKVWSKLSRAIIVAAKNGGGNPDFNLTLRYAIDKAKAANMPNDTIDKAIKKGTGEDDSANYEEVLYQGFGPQGTAVLCEALTDNRNRTAPELRKIFEKGGGQLGGSVEWIFTKRGIIRVPAAETTEDALLEAVMDAGGDAIELNGDVFEITCEPDAYADVKKAVQDAGLSVESAEMSLVPNQFVTLSGSDAQKMMTMMELLDDHDDIQEVHSNFEVEEETATA